ncbi:MAG: O-antigen ligase family protein [Candidatus Aureabacteria bacterium]|nr:O-antigen ligase family protein [Candidatus Auribacterota bacterium]
MLALCLSMTGETEKRTATSISEMHGLKALSKTYNFILYLGLTFLVVFPPVARGGSVRIWSITPVLLVIVLLVFLWLMRVVNSDVTLNVSGCPSVLNIAILCFTLLAAISFYFSIYKHDSFYALLRLLCYAGLFYLIIGNYSRPLRRYLTAVIILTATGLSIYGLLQYFGLFPHNWWGPPAFLASTYVNHNHFSGYLELAIPLTLGVVIRYKNIKPATKLFIFEALVIMAATFIFARSRGAWTGLSFALLFMMMVLAKRGKFRIRYVAIILISVLIVFSVIFAGHYRDSAVAERSGNPEDISVSDTGEASMKARFIMWKGTFDMIKANPVVGTGIGTYMWGFSRYRPEGFNSRANFAHNDYLHLTAEMGVVALPLMLIILGIIIYKGFTSMNPVIIGCAAGILSLSIHGLVDFNFHIPANMIIFIIYMAFIMADASARADNS